MDPGTKSEGEEEAVSKGRGGLGRTPNHLTLSTTSTLSAGSTGSQARLIQSSQQPSNYQPPPSTDLGESIPMNCFRSMLRMFLCKERTGECVKQTLGNYGTRSDDCQSDARMGQE